METKILYALNCCWVSRRCGKPVWCLVLYHHRWSEAIQNPCPCKQHCLNSIIVWEMEMLWEWNPHSAAGCCSWSQGWCLGQLLRSHGAPGTEAEPHRDKGASFSAMSRSQEETPTPLTFQQTSVKKKDKPLCEFSTRTDLLEPEVSRPRQDQATDRSSHGRDTGLPKTVYSSSKSLLVQPRGAFPQQESNSLSDPERKRQFNTNRSDQEDLREDWQLKRTQKFGLSCGLRGGINVAEMYKRKLKKVRMMAKNDITQFLNCTFWHAEGAWMKTHTHRLSSVYSALADFVCVCVCVPFIFRSWRSCQRNTGPAETDLRCSVTSLMMYVKAHQYLDASWGKLRFFHFLCAH